MEKGKKMIDVKNLYKEERFGWYDYDPMIEAFGNVAVRDDDRDYQGDTRVLYNNGGRIGHLIFGWGSCPGCDALQACGSLDDVQELCDSLEESIMWFETPKAALEWFTSHDWRGDYSWYYNETREYVDKAIKYLSELERGGTDG